MVEIDWANLDGAFSDRVSSITVGVFDGVHLGHRALIDRVVASDWMPVVVTFQRHPSDLLLHDDVPGFIMSLRQKRAILTDLGIEVAVQIDFSESFRSIPGLTFLRALEASFDIRRIVVGHDFRCGYRLDTDVGTIEQHYAGRDVEVIAVEPVVVESQPVSSSRIRGLILRGELEDATRLLGRPYTLDTTDETIERDGRRLYIVKDERGLLPENRQLLPPPGNYRATVGDAKREHDVELVIGINSVSWPLVAPETIRYIVVHQRRI